jgi:hypothetical protein
MACEIIFLKNYSIKEIRFREDNRISRIKETRIREDNRISSSL